MLVFVAHVATLVVTAAASADVDTAAFAAVGVSAVSDVAAAAVAVADAATAPAAASALTTLYCFFVFCDFFVHDILLGVEREYAAFATPSSTPPSIPEWAFLVFSYLLLPPVLISLAFVPDSYQDTL